MPLTIAGKELIASGEISKELLEDAELAAPVSRGMKCRLAFDAAKSQIVDEGKRILKARINTDDLDDHGTVIMPAGCKIEAFMMHPTVLLNHNPNNIIGKGLNLNIVAHYIDSTWQFVPKGIADATWTLVKGNFIRGYSIGFLVNDYTMDPVREGQRGATVTDWTLREFSLTPLPVNPYAISQNSLASDAWMELRSADPTLPEIPVEKHVWVNGKTFSTTSAKDTSNTLVSVYVGDLTDELQRQMQEAERLILALRETTEELEQLSVGGSRSLPLDKDSAWDGAAAKRAMAKAASSDGSGDKDKVNWGKYRRGFAIYDSEKPESFGSYKLPFAIVKGGKLTAVWRGVVAAAVVLQGGRSPVQAFQAGDIEGAKRLLAAYYRKAGETPPWERDKKSFDWLPAELEFINDPTFETYELDIQTDNKEKIMANQERAGAVGVQPFPVNNPAQPPEVQDVPLKPNKPQVKSDESGIMEALAKNGGHLKEIKLSMADIKGVLATIKDGQDAIADAISRLIEEK